jgi:hypothetical protein
MFDSEQQVFQVNTHIKPGVVKEVRQVIILNGRTWTYGKQQTFQRLYSHVLACRAKNYLDFT